MNNQNNETIKIGDVVYEIGKTNLMVIDYIKDGLANCVWRDDASIPYREIYTVENLRKFIGD